MKFSLALFVLALAAASPAAAQDDSEDPETAARIERMTAGRSWVRGAELDAALAEAARHPLGSEDNPVRAAMPPGQRAYLARLRCADGRAPAYDRLGAAGQLGPYGNIVDLYEVTCAGAAPVTVVIDMYHAGYVERRPVPGFTIVAP